jgi:hypothetical protein
VAHSDWHCKIKKEEAGGAVPCPADSESPFPKKKKNNVLK